MSPFASPSPFMSNRRPKPSPPLTHERGGAQEWHPPFARNGGATGTPPLPLFTCEQDTRMRDKPPPPLPFARKEEAQERGADMGRLCPPSLLPPPLPCLHANRARDAGRRGKGTRTPPPSCRGPARLARGSTAAPPGLRAEATCERGADAGVRTSAPHTLCAPTLFVRRGSARTGRRAPTWSSPPLPGFVRTSGRANRGARQSKTRRGRAGAGDPSPPGSRTRARRKGVAARGTPFPRVRAPRRIANGRPRRRAPPSPGLARLGESAKVWPHRTHPPPPLRGSRTRAKPRRGGRAGHPPSGVCAPGPKREGVAVRDDHPLPRVRASGQNPKGAAAPPRSHQDKNANRRPRGGPPPSPPRSARKGET
ncbi:hypothetical protein H4582DRAFT_2001173 [Lactarius indigo]|nr:hypothetical protein H4582DRAFT_2001173 [Lactarius indigo]